MKLRVFSTDTHSTSCKHFILAIFLLSMMGIKLSAQSEQEALPSIEEVPLRVALLPFCDESSLYTLESAPDNNQFYNFTLSGFKELNSCDRPIEWVSKNRLDRVIASRVSRGTEAGPTDQGCGYYVVDSICKQFTVDLLIVGEYILNANNQVEVYYSYETCAGLNAANIQYLTPQPLVGTPEDFRSLYRDVAQAIRKDLAAYLGCQTQAPPPAYTQTEALRVTATTAPIPPSPLVSEAFEQGYELFLAGDTSSNNYLEAIQVFETISSDQADFHNAQYHIALAHLGLGEYLQAEQIFQTLQNFKKSQLYLKFAKLRTKPAEWYDSPQKRRDWWERLSSQWKEAFTFQVLNLPSVQEPTDIQLLSLFQLTRVRFNETELEDISGLIGLTNLTHVTLYKVGLKSLKDIEKLPYIQRLNCNKNKLKDLGNIDMLGDLEYLYIQKNPVKSLAGLEDMDAERFVLFCGNSVPLKEILRIRELGIKVQM